MKQRTFGSKRVIGLSGNWSAGLRRFRNPQTPGGLVKGTELADDVLQVRLAGDQALFAARTPPPGTDQNVDNRPGIQDRCAGSCAGGAPARRP